MRNTIEIFMDKENMVEISDNRIKGYCKKKRFKKTIPEIKRISKFRREFMIQWRSFYHKASQ